MTLSDVSIKNPVFAWMLMIGLMAFGWIGFHRMGISQLPDVDFPVVTITVTWEDAAPEIMETQVADIIEDAVMGVEGVQSVYSTSSMGQTRITVELNLNRSIDAAMQDVQSCIAQAQRNLPAQIDPPIIQKVNPEDQPTARSILTIVCKFSIDFKKLSANRSRLSRLLPFHRLTELSAPDRTARSSRAKPNRDRR